MSGGSKAASTGKSYADLIANYIVRNFGGRNIEVFREIPIGKSIIGKNRRIDIVVLNKDSNDALAIECKFQEVQGTVDEKIPYALNDMESLAINMKGCIVYAGRGFSEGVMHMLQASEIACYCLPKGRALSRTKTTAELDHFLARSFHWWDLLLKSKKPVKI